MFTALGSGFEVTDSEALSVSINGIETEITGSTDTEINFKLGDTSRIVRIDNTGIDESKFSDMCSVTSYYIYILYKYIQILKD